MSTKLLVGLRSPSEDKYAVRQNRKEGASSEEKRIKNVLIFMALSAIGIWAFFFIRTFNDDPKGTTNSSLRRHEDKISMVTAMRQKRPQPQPQTQQKQHHFDVTASPSPSPYKSVLVVLGNEPLDDTTPTIDTMDRVKKAVEYYQKNPTSTMLIFTGGPTAGKTTEAMMMSQYAQSLGVKEKDIRLEEKARSTKQNAILSARLLIRENITPKETFVVSKADHLTWAMALFKGNDVPQRLFEDSIALPCTVKKEDVMQQLNEYITTHVGHPRIPRIKMRLEMLRKGQQGID